MRSPVAKEGWPFIIAFAVIAAVGDWLCPDPVGDLPLWILTLWCIWFFRDPDRSVPSEPGVLIAPADGRVCAIDEVAEAPITRRPARKLSIFMNVFNVHVNRMPEAGEVVAMRHHAGRFFNAALDKASLENERAEVLLKTSDGLELPMVQVAGLVARRIICRAAPGSRWERGQRFGLIRFGSRVDLYLPLDADIALNIGDRTCAGQTIVASLAAPVEIKSNAPDPG